MWGLTVDVANRLTSHPGRRAGSRLSAQQRALAEAAARSDAALGRARHARRHDRLGQLRHARRPARRVRIPQLTTLSRALAAFKADLTARGVEQNVVTMVFSEFGRRLEESDSKGTDHGSGGPIMLSGSAVKGGLAGEHPGRQRQPGRRPRRQDRLPHRLPVADRRMAGRRPDRHPAGRPVPGRGALRRRHHAAEGRVGRHVARWLDGRPSSPSWCSPSQRHREWRDRPASASTGCTCRRHRRCRRCRSRSRWTSSSGACAARTSQVAAGRLQIHVYNRGMDDHDLAVVDAHGRAAHGPAGLGRRRGARRRRRGRPGEAVLLAVRRARPTRTRPRAWSSTSQRGRSIARST